MPLKEVTQEMMMQEIEISNIPATSIEQLKEEVQAREKQETGGEKDVVEINAVSNDKNIQDADDKMMCDKYAPNTPGAKSIRALHANCDSTVSALNPKGWTCGTKVGGEGLAEKE